MHLPPNLLLLLILTTSIVACSSGPSSQSEVSVDADCGECIPECTAPGAGLVYTVNQRMELRIYDPSADTEGAFEMMGVLPCDTQQPPLPGLPDVWPYSMTSDRNGHLLIFYSNGELFDLEVGTMTCTKTDWNGDELVTMAYAGEQAQRHRLFMGLNPTENSGPGAYAEVDPSTLEIGTRYELEDQTGVMPNLAGAPDGTMWGFRPSQGKAGIVERLDIATGLTLERWDVPDHGREAITSWASAFWRGNAILFTTRRITPSRSKQTIASFDPSKPEDQQLTYLDTDADEIWLAANSTCAP